MSAEQPDREDQNTPPLRPNAETRGRIYSSILDTIGNTPLVRVPRLQEKHALQGEILAKLEFFNPLGSVKDRIAFAMIEAAEREGMIKPGVSTLVEPTSGNTGVGLAFVAAQKGYRLILTMPESMSVERRKMLRFLGAEMILTPAPDGMKGAIAEAERLLRDVKNAHLVGQFQNPANPQIHRETTAREIWEDTAGEIDVLIAGVGTGGSISGIADALKAKKPDMRAYAVEPAESPVIGGGEPGPHKIQGIGAGFVPDNLNTQILDGVIQIDSDRAIKTAQEMGQVEGIPAGISSGAAMAAAIDVAIAPENAGKKIVVILASHSERYISTALFDGLLGS